MKMHLPAEIQKPLNPKQLRFVQEYLVDTNATQACIRAGYSPKAAKVTGSRMLANANVGAAVRWLQQTVAERLGITVERVLLERKRLALHDIRKLYDEKGNLLPVHQLDEDTAAALASVEVDEITAGDTTIGQTRKVKLADKDKSLAALEKHLGLYKDEARSSIPGINIHIHV